MRGQRALKAILGFSILSTGLHYTHNFVEIEEYPQSSAISNDAVQVALVLSWPVLTLAALYGYRLYSQGRLRPAQALIALHSLLGLATVGHFTAGNPDIPPFWYSTIFTDAIAGVLVLGFAVWSARTEGPAAAGVEARARA